MMRPHHPGSDMIEIALLAVFPALMAYAAVSDLLTMKIPNQIGS